MAVIINNAHLNPWQRRPDTARNPGTSIMVAQVHAGLSHTIPFEDRMAGERLKVSKGFGGKGRTAGTEEA